MSSLFFRPLHVLTGGLAAGIAAALLRPDWGLPVACALWACAALLSRRGRERLPLLIFLLAAASGLARGAGVAAPASPLDRLAPARGVVAAEFRGTVDGEVVRRADRDGRVSLVFRMRLAGDGRRALVRLRVPPKTSAPAIEPGARVVVAGQAGQPPPPGNPGERDRREAWRRDGIVLFLTAPSTAVRIDDPHESGGGQLTRRLGARLRSRLLRRLSAAVGDRPAARAIAAGVLLGERAGLPEQVRHQFRTAGAAHLLAVSGLHVVLLIGSIAWVVGRLTEQCVPGPRGRALTIVVALASLATYALACRLATPVLRASTFLALAQIARARGRRTTTADLLAAAALLVLAVEPGQVLDAGFQLSFSAVAGLCTLTTRFREALFADWDLLARFPEALPRWNLRLRLWFAGAFSASLAASTATAPVTAAVFGELHPASVIANVVAIPVVAVLLPLCAVAAVAGPLAEPVLGPLIAVSGSCLTGIVELVATCPWATVSRGRVAPVIALVAVAALVGSALAGPWRRRHLALPLAVWIGLALAPATGHIELPEGRPALVALDVGHGQAIVIADGAGGALLADAGGRMPGTAERRLLPALRAMGVERLTAVILSHEDADHCGAAPEVLSAMPVGAVLVPPGFGGDPAGRRVLETCRRVGVPVVVLARGDAWQAGGLRVRALQPSAGRPGPAGNDGSLVAHVTAAARGAARHDTLSVLLPGDVEATALDALAGDPTLPTAEVLVLPHHGRGEVAPQVALARRCGARHLIASTSEGAASEVPRCVQTGRDGAVLLTPRRPVRRLVR